MYKSREDYLARRKERPTIGHNKPPASAREALQDRVDNLVNQANRLIKAGAARAKPEADEAADLANTLGRLSQEADDKRKDEQREWRDRISASNAVWNPLRDIAQQTGVTLKQVVIDPFLNRIEAEAKTRAEQRAQLGVPAHPEEVENITAGTSGRRVHRRTVTDVKIIDYYKALDHLKDHPEISALVLKLAQRSVRMGVIVPGTEIIQGKVSV